MHSLGAMLLVGLLSIFSLADPAGALALGPVTELTGPSDFTTSTHVIDFDGVPDATVANTLYLAQGVEFENTGAPVPIENWTDAPLSRVTTSPTNVIATTLDYHG